MNLWRTNPVTGPRNGQRPSFSHRTMQTRGFEGWYFKHQRRGETIAFIPGRAESGAFVQMIDSRGSRQFDVPELTVEHGVIRAGNCLFSGRGVVVDLPGVSGTITYGPLTPLRSDIMGPFQFLPMECRHGVLSMRHTLDGTLLVDGKERCFDKGTGYIEKDSGTSFPSAYLWLQCSDFSKPCSLMVSIAHIPFAGLGFTGCICAIVFEGREYRLATYRGVRIRSAGAEHLCLTQGKLLLEIEMQAKNNGHPLRAPVRGQMSGIIRESHEAEIVCRLWDSGTPVFHLKSNHASFEFMWPDSPRK